MIGNFSNEIRRLFDSAFTVKSYGWSFPNQIGRFNTFYTTSKLISGKTSFLLAGDNMGPEKLKKAQNLGVPIISEEDFEKMIS